jgi:hypothetical protein
MNKVIIELEPEQIDAVVIADINSSIEAFEEYLEKRANDEGFAIFDSDPIKDVEYLLEHIQAFKLVLEYYGGNVEN